MNINSRLNAFATELSTLGVAVSHYWHAVKNAPLIIWAEERTESFHADGRTSERCVVGTVDLFTKTEFDPLVDALQNKLDAVCFSVDLNSILYETETGLIHYSWEVVF